MLLNTKSKVVKATQNWIDGQEEGKSFTSYDIFKSLGLEDQKLRQGVFQCLDSMKKRGVLSANPTPKVTRRLTRSRLYYWKGQLNPTNPVENTELGLKDLLIKMRAACQQVNEAQASLVGISQELTRRLS